MIKIKMDRNRILRILKELSIEKLDEDHVVRGDPNYYKILELDLNHYTDILSLCAKRLKKLKVLEIGIGYAYLAVLVRRLLNYEVVGIDHANRSYINDDRWKSLLDREGIQFKVCDVIYDPLPFENESFDMVTCCEVIEHLPISPRKLLNDIHRVLKKNGTLILTTPNFARLRYRISLLLGKNPIELFPDELPKDPYHIHIREYTPRELISLLKQTKFSIEKLYFSDCWDRPNKRLLRLLYRVLMNLVPSFRSDIMVTAKKRPATDNFVQY